MSSTCGPNRTHLCSMAMWLSGGSPTHALSTFSMAARCRDSALTRGAPAGTSGALHRYDSSDSTGWNDWSGEEGDIWKERRRLTKTTKMFEVSPFQSVTDCHCEAEKTS